MNRYLVAGIFALSLTNGAYAACTSHEAPALPDPETAVLAQMVKAQNEVKNYIKSQEAYLSCTKSGLRYDRAMKEMQKVASSFNNITRAYKARS